MSQFYTPKRKKNIFDPKSKVPFNLSRSKIDFFMNCPRCFYIDRRLGVGQPSGPPFSLNKAVDELLKKEFDIHRIEGNKHPLIERYGLDCVPFQHENMGKWRDNFSGVQYHHKKTNFIVTGAIDDLWINGDGQLHVVDYKATSNTKEITLDEDWKIIYKRQVEIYQWLLRRNGFDVSDLAYFVYCNGSTDREAFDAKLEFDVKILPYEGSDDWIEQTIIDAHDCLMQNELPDSGPECDFCAYTSALNDLGI